MTKRSGNPIDVVVGQNIRQLRNERGMSQEKLGDALGITFQQIQKYEKGSNRVSASTLVGMSKALGVNVHALFQGTDAPDMPLTARDTLADKIAALVRKITDPDKKESVLRVVQAML